MKKNIRANPSLKFLKEALNEAKKAQKKDEVPVGAVIVKDGKIIARAHNLREQNKNALAHAEILAIEKACKKLRSWRLIDCELYVTLEPCPMCAGALQQARIEHVYFGTADPKNGALSLNLNIHNNDKLNHRFEMQNLEVSDCGKILSDFFGKKRLKIL